MTDRTPENNGQERHAPPDPRALREEIERTRADVGDTVESLAARTDVRGQVREKATEVAGRTRDRIGDGSAALRHKGEELRDRLGERGGPQGERTGAAVPDRAQGAARQATETARQHPGKVAGLLAAVLAARWLIRRRRRRHAARTEGASDSS